MSLRPKEQRILRVNFEPTFCTDPSVVKRVVIVTDEPDNATHEIPVQLQFSDR